MEMALPQALLLILGGSLPPLAIAWLYLRRNLPAEQAAQTE